jgi:hypothetical protein
MTTWDKYETLKHLTREEIGDALILAIDLVDSGEGVPPSYYFSEVHAPYPYKALETLKIFEHIAGKGMVP